jgi:hypothetical protein
LVVYANIVTLKINVLCSNFLPTASLLVLRVWPVPTNSLLVHRVWPVPANSLLVLRVMPHPIDVVAALRQPPIFMTGMVGLPKCWEVHACDASAGGWSKEDIQKQWDSLIRRHPTQDIDGRLLLT